MLKDPQAHRTVFINYTERLLEGFETVKASGEMQNKPQTLVATVNDIVKVCRAILLLVSPIPPVDSSVADVNEVRQMKAGNFVMTTIVDALSKHAFWQKMFDEVLSKGTASMEARPQVASFLDELSTTVMSRQDSCIPAELLASILDKLPEWKKTTRPGFLDVLEKELLAALLQTAEVMTQLPDVTTASITMSFMDSVITSLGMFKTPDAFNMVNKLQKFKVKQSQNLLVADLQKLLSEYPGTDDGDGQFTSSTFCFEGRLALLHSTLQECKSMKFADEVEDGLRRAVYWQFKHLYLILREIWVHENMFMFKS